MKASLLTQIAPENRLLKRLGPAAKDAESAFVAVSFIQRSGMKHLFQRLRLMLAKRRPVTIFTSGYLGITDPLALEDLLRLSVDFPFLKPYFNLDDRFHSKFLLFEKPSNAYGLFLGSSNISVEGLAATGELNIHVQGQKSDRIYRDIQIVIDNLTKGRRFVPLTDDLIDQYRRLYPKRPAKRSKPRQQPRVVLAIDKMPVYVIKDEFTKEEQERIEKIHPRWKIYVSYGSQLSQLHAGDHFLCISQFRGRKPTFTVSKYLENDRIDGAGTVAHTKDGDSFSLKRLADRLNVTQKDLLSRKWLDVYDIAIMRQRFKKAFG